MHNLPFVRCVGIGTAIYQNELKMAYDYRMICILSGDGFVEIDKERLNTRAGDIYIINPGTSYRVRSFENQEIAVVNFDTTYEYAHIKEPVLSVNADTFKADEIILTPPVDFVKNKIYKVSAADAELLEELYQTYLRDDIYDELKSFLLSSKLLYIISKMLTTPKKSRSVASDIYNYILDNACGKITTESVAQAFNYSTSYVEKILRRNYDISLKQLVLDTRLKKAIWLLENTSLSCWEISSQLGFYSSQHFAQMFKKKYGQNPSDVR
ncbi:MAG: AraC family transcriptional regulator [Clostridia bacterium]|nr:AraC family transcriptional regulator [Clostridia bacterium]